MPGRSVTCITTGEVYSSISSAERENGIKSGTLSSCIKSGDPIDGKIYKFTDELDVPDSFEEEVVEDTEKETEEDPDTIYISDVEVDSVDVEEKEDEEQAENDLNKKDNLNYNVVGSLSKMYELAQKYRLKGYDCEVVEETIVFFQIQDEDEIRKIATIANQNPEFSGRFKVTPYDSARYLDMISTK